MSWRAEVIADDSGKWCGNMLLFANDEEAQQYVKGLAARWTLVRETRVVEVSDREATHRWTRDGAKAGMCSCSGEVTSSCLMSREGLVCTLPMKHEGVHRACGYHVHDLWVW